MTLTTGTQNAGRQRGIRFVTDKAEWLFPHVPQLFAETFIRPYITCEREALVLISEENAAPSDLNLAGY